MSATIAKEKERNVEQKAHVPAVSLGSASVVGAGYVIAAYFIVIAVVPHLWETTLATLLGQNPNAPTLISQAMRLGLMAVSGGVLYFLWSRLFPAREGFRTAVGVAVGFLMGGAVGIYWLSLLVQGILGWLKVDAASQPMIGGGVALALAILWLRYTWQTFHHPKFLNFLEKLDEQQLFVFEPYKKSQGNKVRQATLLGFVVLIGCGVVHFLSTINSGLTGFWELRLPFQPDWQKEPYWALRLAYMPGLTVSLTIVLGLLWFAYRSVHAPIFADFLIATETEVNKISWSTMRRLRQDTTIVLIITALITAGLFVLDLGWASILTFLGVIKH